MLIGYALQRSNNANGEGNESFNVRPYLGGVEQGSEVFFKELIIFYVSRIAVIMRTNYGWRRHGSI